MEFDWEIAAWAAGFAVLGATLYYALRHLKQMPRLAAYIELIRPFTLVAPLIAGACFGLMGAASTGWARWDILQLLYGAGTLVLVNAASNALNAVHDLEIDRINKPNRPLPQGLIDPQEATTVAYLLYLLSIFRAFYINASFAAFVGVIIFLTIAYSAPPLRLKRLFLVNNLNIALARGLFGVLAGWSIFGDPFNSVPWTIGAILVAFLFGAATTKDFTDIPGDRAYGIKTLPVVIGVERAATVTASFFLVPIVFIPVTVYFELLYYSANYLLLLAFWGVYVLRHTKEWAQTPDPTFENNPMWKHMYLLLMALALGFSATYIWQLASA